MYKFITKREYKENIKIFNQILYKLHHSIKEKYKITFSHMLIGSARSNLVMRNGEDAIDFDFNLELQKVNNNDPEK